MIAPLTCKDTTHDEPDSVPLSPALRHCCALVASEWRVSLLWMGLMIHAEAFYASATFWQAGTFFVLTITGLGAMWATLRAANPGRRLAYWVTDTPLLHPSRSLTGNLEVHHNGSVLSDPRILQVLVLNLGRRDIVSTSFDQGLPLRVVVSVPVLEQLGVKSLPSTSEAPPARVHEKAIHIGPGRIGRGVKVTYFFLIDGGPSCTLRHSLIDVKVDQGELRNAKMEHLTTAITLLAGLLLTGGALWLTELTL